MLIARCPRAPFPIGGAFLAFGAAVTLALAPAARAGIVTMNACTWSEPLSSSWTNTSGPGHNPPLSGVDACGSGGRMQITGPKVGPPVDYPGDYDQWATTLPSAMSLTWLSVPAQAPLINPYTENNGEPSGFHVRYMWGGGATAPTDAGNCCGGLDYANPTSQAIAGGYFIIQVACNGISATDPICELPVNGSDIVFAVKNLTLTATDTTPPTIGVPSSAGGGTNLGAGPRFVRGSYELAFSGANANASGVCGMAAYINGAQLPTVVGNTPDTTVWQQCPATANWAQTVNTASYPDGPLSIAMYASDAANPANVGSSTESLVVDNQPVTVALSGPTDALSTAGPANITATATAGPSGVQGIWCSVDGGSYAEHAGASVQIPVAGLGLHQVSCYAENRALDASGAPARSATQTLSLTIRQPTEAAISFSKLKDPLVCHRVRAATHTHRRVVVRHGRKVTVPARTIRHRVVRCHARTVRRVVSVIVMRHGKQVRIRQPERVVVLPHRVGVDRQTVAYGRGATVSGVLLTSAGSPLAGEPVAVLTAPNNGLHQFTQVAAATTDASGGWSVQLPTGPSRLIVAAYGGSETLEPTISTPVRLSVPARIVASISPRRLRWSGTITIRGHLVGGYVPADGVALRLLVRYPHAKRWTPLLALRTTSGGQFAITWSYHAGRGTATYPFKVATTATESDYPFAAASSRAIRVTFRRAGAR